jgi:hypothetical protein
MTMAPTVTRVAPARRQSLTVGIILLGLALFVAGVFAVGSEGVAVFRLSHPRDTLQLPHLAVSGGTGSLSAVSSACVPWGP